MDASLKYAYKVLTGEFVLQSIRTQYETANNYPDHCGYGPVSYGEGHRTEKKDAGMPARSKTWQATKTYPHASRPRPGSSVGKIGSICWCARL